jgi:hypothetical protein
VGAVLFTLSSAFVDVALANVSLADAPLASVVFANVSLANVSYDEDAVKVLFGAALVSESF